jgi:hypothetical protein
MTLAWSRLIVRFARSTGTCEDGRKITYLEQQIAVETRFISVTDTVGVVISDKVVAPT